MAHQDPKDDPSTEDSKPSISLRKGDSASGADLPPPKDPPVERPAATIGEPKALDAPPPPAIRKSPFKAPPPGIGKPLPKKPAAPAIAIDQPAAKAAPKASPVLFAIAGLSAAATLTIAVLLFLEFRI
ncbi:MAG: hypothetical protein EA425_13340 [Puniceicoccaceae bacterium]|nr:MAG: hypothetical protein EA425_13340 [Puniceicoccaceae bacterium]